jgi:hypothetical protein
LQGAFNKNFEVWFLHIILFFINLEIFNSLKVSLLAHLLVLFCLLNGTKKVFMIYLYNILGGRPFHPSFLSSILSSISSSIHPSSSSRKKKMMEEEEEGGGRKAALAVYVE